jgi:hypothetical protein
LDPSWAHLGPNGPHRSQPTRHPASQPATSCDPHFLHVCCVVQDKRGTTMPCCPLRRGRNTANFLGPTTGPTCVQNGPTHGPMGHTWAHVGPRGPSWATKVGSAITFAHPTGTDPMVVRWWSNGGPMVVQWWSNGGPVVVHDWAMIGP